MSKDIVIYVFCMFIWKYCIATDFIGSNKISSTNFNDWLQEVNIQYLALNQLSASFAWDLIIDPNSHVYDEASQLGKHRSKWQHQRCTEAEEMTVDNMTDVQKRMVWLLCRGPRYTEYQGGELSAILNEIQNIYSETEICLPKAFDVCINVNRIWDYTYARTPDSEIVKLNMRLIEPKLRIDFNPLNYFDGNVTDDYYIFRGLKDLSHFSQEFEIDEKIRESEKFCLDIERDLEKIMAGNFSALHRLDCALPQDVIVRWAWESWRLAVGPEIGNSYPSAVYLMNAGAQNNGYNDIGECWREELEIPDLENFTQELWHKIKPYYQLLHGVLRNVLYKKFQKPDFMDKKGPIPAHLLGNMWSQDWSSYHKLLSPFSDVYIEDNVRNSNWSTLDMVKRAEDFFTSMGRNQMTQKFWDHSKFEKTKNNTKCHGSAGNMFTGDDYRMIVCAETTLNDFYVIVHEMGHIEYYMHVLNQPPLFQDATNSAFGEAIGDAIFLGIMSPQHLIRLGLLNDKFLAPTRKLSTRELRVVHENNEAKEFRKAPIPKSSPKFTTNDVFTLGDTKYPDFDSLNAKMDTFMRFKDVHDKSINEFDLSHLLRLALEKIPHIPFEYILDQWRWKIFSGEITMEDANAYFWKLSMEEQGIHAPDWINRRDMFDAAAKYHVADNTPYVRYFLSSFLQVQIFKGLCEKTVFGKFNTGQELPMPLHRCDIYGSKRAGHILKKALSLGSSVHWSEVLYILTGSREISAQPLIEYYQPLFTWLEKIAIEYDIPIGW
ncbi:angiotensin-converting enzyme-like [Episyrphus balteatus]|uniref:angiotensin-converting enzyme-like n=1 Tax=Episyrphus balteatus TaxID=286459 RepID=UPI002486824E|nr:angiotensin-converting enzyme-like [Episyrphus balteatus]